MFLGVGDIELKKYLCWKTFDKAPQKIQQEQINILYAQRSPTIGERGTKEFINVNTMNDNVSKEIQVTVSTGKTKSTSKKKSKSQTNTAGASSLY